MHPPYHRYVFDRVKTFAIILPDAERLGFCRIFSLCKRGFPWGLA